MLESTLLTKESLTKKSLTKESLTKEKIESDEFLKEVDTDELRKVFHSYKKGMWIYPGFIIRELHIKPEIAYKFLMDLEKENIIKGYYELYCSCCQKSNGRVETFKDIPETFVCNYCNKELVGIENAVIIYKVR